MFPHGISWGSRPVHGAGAIRTVRSPGRMVEIDPIEIRLDQEIFDLDFDEI